MASAVTDARMAAAAAPLACRRFAVERGARDASRLRPRRRRTSGAGAGVGIRMGTLEPISTVVFAASANRTAPAASAAAPSTDAFTLRCPNFDACPGCSLATELDNPPMLTRARAYFARRGIPDFQAHTGEVHGWRTRAKLAARDDGSGSGHLALGLFARGTHDLVQIPNCAVHHPRINQAAALITVGLVDLPVTSSTATHVFNPSFLS